MNKYFPLHVHSHFSLLDGLSKPEHIADRIVELGLDGSVISDHGTLAGSIAFLKAMKDVGKKAIIGCELYISELDSNIRNENNRKHTHTLVLAKNDAGWKTLLKLTAEASSTDSFYYKPRLSIEQLCRYADGNLICISGHWGSTIADQILDAKGNVLPDGLEKGTEMAKRLQQAFGEDFYLECQLVTDSLPLVEVVRQIAKTLNIKCVATPDAHYAWKRQAIDQRILLCANLNTTIYAATNPDFGMSGFFMSDNFHIPSYEEMIAFGNTEEELANTLEVAGKCGEYTNILSAPRLPPFECPEGNTPFEWLMKICRNGMDKFGLSGKLEYEERLAEELRVFNNAGLASYFLIIKDILDYVHQNGWLPGPGRGSSAGCLVSYLIGITAVDSVKYDLYFERFYNEGRNTKDRISMPDIDIDVPTRHRDKIIQYIKDKFGHDKVAQMVAFQTLKGRGALKAVLRAYGAVTATEMNMITRFFPEEAKIADELNVMKEEDGESSIIRWKLENDKKGELREWCYLDEADNTLKGPLAQYFEQAIRLEGTKCSQSRHPAGIIIAPESLENIFPMTYDSKAKNTIVSLEMNDAEAAGGIKYDILGITLLDKMMGVSDILEYGDIQH